MADPTPLADQLQQLIYLTTLKSHNALTPEDTTKLNQVQQAINDANKADPNAVSTAYATLDPAQQKMWEALVNTENTATGAGATTNPDGSVTIPQASIGQFIAGVLQNQGGGGGALSINEQVAAQQQGKSYQTGTAVTYQNLPTPEEYMNNWDNAFSAHVSGLRASGAISSEAADWAQSQSTMFYGNYIRAQLADALKGKPMFKLSGLNPDNKLVGTRQGTYDTSYMTDAQKSAYNMQQQSTGASGGLSTMAIDGMIRAIPGPQVGAAAAARSAAASGGGGSSLNLSETGTSDTQNQTLQSQQEAIVQRNELGVVSALAPLDFLKDNMDAGKLNLLYEGQKGTQAASRETATTEAPTRRIG
jgi:hypothetical protein